MELRSFSLSIWLLSDCMFCIYDEKNKLSMLSSIRSKNKLVIRLYKICHFKKLF